MNNPPVHPKLRVATVGLGNWAGSVLDRLLMQHKGGNAGFSLEALCEPNPAAHPERLALLKSHNIPVLDRFDDLLELRGIDAVALPVPIHLHRAMTEQALLAGKAVLVEKPAAGCVQDVDAMIAARDRARLPVLVSFQDSFDPVLLHLKRAILNGEIGAIRSASLVGCWPRDEAYYARTNWAGKIRHNEMWVLDSPISNAFAHYLHLALFLLGTQERAWAVPEFIEAELYRVYPIENFDTASLRVVASGVPLLTLLTHACQETIGPLISVTGERGSISIDLMNRSAMVRSDRGTRNLSLHPEPRDLVMPAFTRHVRGLPVEAPVTEIQLARPHVVTVNGASQAASVQTVDESAYVVQSSPTGEHSRYIPGIEQLFLRCATGGKMVHESGNVNWSVPPGAMSLLGYDEFTACSQKTTYVQNVSKLLRPPAAGKHAYGKPSLSEDSV